MWQAGFFFAHRVNSEYQICLFEGPLIDIRTFYEENFITYQNCNLPLSRTLRINQIHNFSGSRNTFKLGDPIC